MSKKDKDLEKLGVNSEPSNDQLGRMALFYFGMFALVKLLGFFANLYGVAWF